MFLVSARLLVIFAWIVSTDVGIRPFGRRTAVPRLERQPAGRVLVGGELVGDSFDEVGEARSLAVVIGDAEMPASADMTAAVGNWSSRKVPRMDWRPLQHHYRGRHPDASVGRRPRRPGRTRTLADAGRCDLRFGSHVVAIPNPEHRSDRGDGYRPGRS